MSRRRRAQGGPDSTGGCRVTSCGHLRGMGWHWGDGGAHMLAVPSSVHGAKGIFLAPAFSPCLICSAWLPGQSEVGRKGGKGRWLKLQACLRVGDKKKARGLSMQKEQLGSTASTGFQFCCFSHSLPQLLGLVVTYPRWQHPPGWAALPCPASAAPGTAVQRSPRAASTHPDLQHPPCALNNPTSQGYAIPKNNPAAQGYAMPSEASSEMQHTLHVAFAQGASAPRLGAGP